MILHREMRLKDLKSKIGFEITIFFFAFPFTYVVNSIAGWCSPEMYFAVQPNHDVRQAFWIFLWFLLFPRLFTRLDKNQRIWWSGPISKNSELHKSRTNALCSFPVSTCAQDNTNENERATWRQITNWEYFALAFVSLEERIPLFNQIN